LWYLKTPGWYRYFFSIHLLAIIFFPAAARSLFGRLAPWALMGLVLVQSVHLYRNYNAFSSRQAVDVAAELATTADLNDSIFVISRPEVAFLLPRRQVSQFIFINQRLSIGERIAPDPLPDYIIAGRHDELFKSDYQAMLSQYYELNQELGNYFIYHKKPI
jgi:hypothetical protein